MITFFKNGSDTVYLVQSGHPLTTDDTARLSWLLASAKPVSAQSLKGRFVGPRKEMITPWSTNAVEICQNMGLDGIVRIEEFHKVAPDADPTYDPMLQRVYEGLKASDFKVDAKPADIVYIEDIEKYNESEGLALSHDEIKYLKDLSARPAPADRQRGVRLLAGQFRALSSQDLQRHFCHRRQGTGKLAVQDDQEDIAGESQRARLGV